MRIEGITAEPEITRINKKLKLIFGQNDKAEAMFRLVWSDAQTEKRFGVYQEHYGKIFLREIRGLREVKKYPYIKERWVLEQWNPPEIAADPSIPETLQGAYEPMWTFEHEEGYPVPVTLELAERIIKIALNKKLPGDRASDLKYEEKREMEKEVEHNMEVLADAGSPLKVDNNPII